MADFTAIGDHVGCFPKKSAAAPATCGAAIEVPERKSKLRPRGSGEKAARMATPGPEMSGFSRSPPLPTDGPREEKPAICG